MISNNANTYLILVMQFLTRMAPFIFYMQMLLPHWKYKALKSEKEKQRYIAKITEQGDQSDQTWAANSYNGRSNIAHSSFSQSPDNTNQTIILLSSALIWCCENTDYLSKQISGVVSH